MALTFDNNTEGLSFSSSKLDLLDAITIMAWYRVSATANAAYTMLSKEFSANSQLLLNRPSFGVGSNDWQFFHRRATTHSNIKTTGNIIQSGRWEWVCLLDSAGTAPTLLHGTLTTKPVEPVYNTQTTGVGAVTDDTGKALVVGRTFDAMQTFTGDLSFLALYNRRMSQAEALSHWPRPYVTSGCHLFTHPGYHGAVAATDLSGNAINAAVIGTPTLANPAPTPAPKLRLARLQPSLSQSDTRRVSLGGSMISSGRIVLAG